MSWAIGVSTGSYYPFRATESALYEIGRLGFPTAELFLQSTSEYTPLYSRRVVRSMLTAAVAVHSIHLHSQLLQPFSPYLPRRQDSDRMFQQALALAARIEARAVTWHGACPGQSQVETGREEVDAGIARWMGWAEEAGLRLAMENVSWCMVRTAEEVTALRARHPALGFTFDSFQAAESGADPIALIEAMGEALVTVHLSDYHPERERHLPPGHGLVPWDSLLTTLAETRYRGPLILELAGSDETEIGRTLLAGREFLVERINSLSLQIRLT